MTGEVSVEALIEADLITEQFHMFSPESNEHVYALLVERRAGLLERWAEAKSAGDWALADRIIADAVDVNFITAAAAEGLQAQRRIVARGTLPPPAHIYAWTEEA